MRHIVVFACVFILLVQSSQARKVSLGLDTVVDASNNNKWQPRLPKFAVPKRYDIKLKPDLITFTFTGSVGINIDIVANTKFIVLNAANLSVTPGSVHFKTPNSSKVLVPKKITLDEKNEILVLKFAKTLPKGLGILGIAFEGILNDKMKGFYRSTNGEKRYMAVTQFEATDARRCFPCWDEPAFKAKFKITLDVSSELVALSNMPVVEEKSVGHLKTVSFQESPLMSTYLVAVAVGMFDYVEDRTTDGIKVRVYTQVGKANQGKLALDVAVRTLDLFKEYFATPYPLPKLDMITVPDFRMGGMENYGLVTYKEEALLYDDDKQNVAIVVAHEVAHQWFGNLVTMEWWTHLWLNEGFATWAGYFAIDRFFPEWKIWTKFVDDLSYRALPQDAVAESHPIEVEINHLNETDGIFDAITYSKGASVVRMLHSYLGPESFKKSLASYIKKYAYSNVKTEDLWAALEEGSGEPVKKVMNTWTKQQGYPVVSVKIKDHKLKFKQSQILSSGSPGKRQWNVPITLCSGSYDARHKFLLQAKSGSLDLRKFSFANESFMDSAGREKSSNAARNWIKLNVDQVGFYRVKYDDGLASRLRYAIESNYLPATDRYGILDDSYFLCRTRQQSLTSLLTMMGAYRKESNPTVLSKLIGMCSKVERIAADATPELMEYFKQFFISLFQNSAEKLGWEPKKGESHSDASLRGEILTALAEYGHDLTQKEAGRRFQAFLDDRNTTLLPPDIRKATYVAVMQSVSTTNRSGYESLLRVYRETDVSEEKMRILSSLASCPDPAIVLEVLNFILSSAKQDVLFELDITWEGRKTAWKWLKDNWEYINKTWSESVITRFASKCVSQFSSFEDANEMEKFFATRIKPVIPETLKQSIEHVRLKANWFKSVRSEKGIADAVKELAYRK